MDIKIEPYKRGGGGIVAMPLQRNIPQPRNNKWKKATCPICGEPCWETELHRQTLTSDPTLSAACTLCALKSGL